MSALDLDSRRARAAPEPELPSGRQFEISFGDQRAVVVESGGGLRSYTAGGRDVVDGYAIDRMCPAGQGQVLIPWPNRVQHGRYTFAGSSHQLALTEPVHLNAIHGLVRFASWAVSEHKPSHVSLEHLLRPQPGYPFSLALRIDYRLSARGLRVTTAAHNVGADPCPFGSGAHPYVTVGTELVDPALIRVPASTVLATDADGIPASAGPVEDTPYDFRRSKPIGTTVLDHCFTDLVRDEDGLARVELRHPSDGTAVALWLDQAYPYLMLTTGDPLPSIRRRSIAVEPMTCPPNAFRTGESLIALDPGSSWTGTWGIEPHTREEVAK